MYMSHKEIWPASYSINDWFADTNANASSNLFALVEEDLKNISFNY